jgi:Zn-dependent protease/predicted transcriptional regulator
MPDIPSYRIGTLFGIPIEVNASWAVIFVLVALSLGSGYYPTVEGAAGAPTAVFALLGVVTTLFFFASIVTHELSHALVTRAAGGHVAKITLFIFGGVAELTEEPATPAREFLMAVAGPCMSLLLSGLSYVAYRATLGIGTAWYVWAPLQYLSIINLYLGAFNQLPGFPLDGGRVLRAVLWGISGDILRATKWAARSGQAIGWTMVAYAVLGVVGVLPGARDVVWLGFIGWFIAWLAGASYRQQVVRSRLATVTAETIMTRSPQTVPGEVTVEQLVHEHFFGGTHSRYPVLFEGAVHGLVTLDGIRGVARQDWPYVRVIDVADRDLASLSIAASAPADSLLPRMASEKTGALLVVGDGRLVGIITRTDLLAAIHRG